jgi:hypothetical protein
MKVPGFLLRRLVVKGSLRSSADGFSFDLSNSLGSGAVDRMLPVTVDGVALPLERAFFRGSDGAEVSFDQVSEAQPFALEMGRTVTIRVDGVPLSPGKHEIGMGFMAPLVGKLAFTFTGTAR